MLTMLGSKREWIDYAGCGLRYMPRHAKPSPAARALYQAPRQALRHAATAAWVVLAVVVLGVGM